jgi:hypothetical protein
MMKLKISSVVASIFVLVPVLYLASCGAISKYRTWGFERVKIGNTETEIIEAMGTPTDIETRDGPQLIWYAHSSCELPCAKRLWYPNRLSLAGEAWGIELDSSGRVIHTVYIISP